MIKQQEDLDRTINSIALIQRCVSEAGSLTPVFLSLSLGSLCLCAICRQCTIATKADTKVLILVLNMNIRLDPSSFP